MNEFIKKNKGNRDVMATSTMQRRRDYLWNLAMDGMRSWSLPCNGHHEVAVVSTTTARSQVSPWPCSVHHKVTAVSSTPCQCQSKSETKIFAHTNQHITIFDSMDQSILSYCLKCISIFWCHYLFFSNSAS